MVSVVSDDGSDDAEAPGAGPAEGAALGDEASDPGESDTDASVYEVESILDERRVGGKLHYLIKWQGYTAVHNTWEPKENIQDAELIDEWNKVKANRPEFKSGSTKGGKKKSPSKAAAAGGRRSQGGHGFTAADAIALDGEVGAGSASPSAGGAAGRGGADARDLVLIAKVRGFWLQRYTQADVCKASCVHPNQMASWLRNAVGPTAMANIEAKLRSWSEDAEAKLNAGDTAGLPAPRKRKLRGDGKSGFGKRGRGRPAQAAGGARAAARVVPPSADLEEDAGDQAGHADAEGGGEESEESEGEGDHRVESLVREMRQGRHRWLLVKWHSLAHAQDTWEPTKHLHEELVLDFDRRKGLPLALSELLEMPPPQLDTGGGAAGLQAVAGGAAEAPEVALWRETMRRENLLPAAAVEPESSEEEPESDDGDATGQEGTGQDATGDAGAGDAGAAGYRPGAGGPGGSGAGGSGAGSDGHRVKAEVTGIDAPQAGASDASMRETAEAVRDGAAGGGSAPAPAEPTELTEPMQVDTPAAASASLAGREAAGAATDGASASLSALSAPLPAAAGASASSTGAGHPRRGSEESKGAQRRSRGRRAKAGPPAPFAAECATGLAEELAARHLSVERTVPQLQRAAEGMRTCLRLPLSTDIQLVVCRAAPRPPTPPVPLAEGGRTEGVCGDATDAAELASQQVETARASQQAARGDAAGAELAVALASSREDRIVRVALPVLPSAVPAAAPSLSATSPAVTPAAAEPTAAEALHPSGGARKSPGSGEGEAGGSGSGVSSKSGLTPGSAASPEVEPSLPLRHVPLWLRMPRKEQFVTDSDSEGEEAVGTSGAEPVMDVWSRGGSGVGAVPGGDVPEVGAPSGEPSQAREQAAGADGAAAGVAHPWAEGLASALARFDRAVDFKKLRGIDVSLSAGVGGAGVGGAATGAGGTSFAACPPEAQRALLYALADRNHIRDHPAVVLLLQQLAREETAAPTAAGLAAGAAAPTAPLPELLWPNRWGRASRARVSYSKLSESDPESDGSSAADGGGGAAGRFVPFGSVVAASGASVRVTVACAAGLVASLPLWGVRPRSDAEWAVRALRPVDVIVLREGERALLQARLEDADGKGLPSRERLRGALVLAPPPPAIPADVHKAVVLQRDGALDKDQMGQKPPLLMPKREVTRWFDSVAEHTKAAAARAAAKAEARTRAELDKGDQLDEAVILPAGTKRRAAQQALEATLERDPALDAWLEEMSEDDDEYEGSAGGLAGDEQGSDEGSSDEGSEEEDSDTGAGLSGGSEGEEGGGRRKRSRKAARLSMDAIRAEAAARAARAGPGGAATSGGAAEEESDEEDEDYVAPGGAGPDDSDSGGGAGGSASGSEEGSDGSEVSGSEGAGGGGGKSRGRPLRRESAAATERLAYPAFDAYLNQPTSSEDESYRGSESDAGEGCSDEQDDSDGQEDCNRQGGGGGGRGSGGGGGSGSAGGGKGASSSQGGGDRRGGGRARSGGGGGGHNDGDGDSDGDGEEEVDGEEEDDVEEEGDASGTGRSDVGEAGAGGSAPKPATKKRPRGRSHGSTNRPRAVGAGGMPDLEGIKRGLSSTLRAALADDWRWASVEQIRGVHGLGLAKASAIHHKLVAAAWDVMVLPQPPGGDSEPPVLATPLEPDPHARSNPPSRSQNPDKQPLKRWTEEEDRSILELRRQGKTWSEIAALLKRTLAALRTRWSQTLKPALVAEGRAGEAAGLPLADLDAVQCEIVDEASVTPAGDAGGAGPEVVPSFIESEVD